MTMTRTENERGPQPEATLANLALFSVFPPEAAWRARGEDLREIQDRLGIKALPVRGSDLLNSSLAMTQIEKLLTEHMTTDEYKATVEAKQGLKNEPLPARQLPGPNLPMDVAREIVDDYPSPLTWWRGDFYQHVGTHWETEDEAAIRSWVRRITERAEYVALDSKGEPKLVRWAPTIKKVSEVTTALGEGVLRRDGEAENVLALANGVLDNGALLPHSPGRFNLTSLPFEYDPTAEPRAWLAFLDSSLPNDPTAHDFLQEWFGYVLSGRTDIQKMASLIGKKRGGKGTISRVLEAMVGANNTTGITLEQLSSQFGMAGLVGKSLATISEPRWASRQAGEAKEPLLRITGGDRVTVDRKYAQEWIGHLGVRFMILSNETPRFSDRTGALASRMIHVRFTVSFEGREDYGLEPRLLAELPGILNWALAGLKRLDANGRFTVPASHEGIQEQFKEYADPDSGFLDFLKSKPFVAEDGSATEAEVFTAYQEWCREAGRFNDSTTAMALRHRLIARDGITARRAGKAKRWTLDGLPRAPLEPGGEQPRADWYEEAV
jgi:putative DNA primase/helicase